MNLSGMECTRCHLTLLLRCHSIITLLIFYTQHTQKQTQNPRRTNNNNEKKNQHAHTCSKTWNCSTCSLSSTVQSLRLPSSAHVTNLLPSSENCIEVISEGLVLTNLTQLCSGQLTYHTVPQSVPTIPCMAQKESRDGVIGHIDEHLAHNRENKEEQ